MMIVWLFGFLADCLMRLVARLSDLARWRMTSDHY
jgi:hypothetical protein